MLRLRPYKPSDAEYLYKWIPREEDEFIKWSAGKFSFPPSREQLDRYY